MFPKRHKNMEDIPSSDDGEKMESAASKTSGEPDAAKGDEGYPNGVRLGMMLLALILAMFFVSIVNDIFTRAR
jgi:hypothetical protein